MKNTLLNYVIAIAIAIAAVELFYLGTYLMNQSDSMLFYLGLFLIGLEVFIGGWYVAKTLNKIFSSDKEKNDETPE
jgi:ABC-type nickel/cobalt efflux system permease component RcnA